MQPRGSPDPFGKKEYEKTGQLNINTQSPVLHQFMKAGQEGPFSHVASFLPKKDLGTFSQVSRTMQSGIKETVKYYKIGYDKNGWAKWDSNNTRQYGWGIDLIVYSNGEISGGGTNNYELAHYARIKQVFDSHVVNGVYTINVHFPTTDQHTMYVGRMETQDDGRVAFVGRFKLIKGVSGHHQVGEEGDIFGYVEEKFK